MIKKYTNTINLFILFIFVILAFIPLKPNNIGKNDTILEGFKMQNASKHVSEISKYPHYLGSQNHGLIRSYIVNELQKLGLHVEFQKTQISNRFNTYSQVENIVAKIKGSDSTRKSLVIMSHYDSVPYASLGAGDDASGVAVLLEGLRIYLAQNIKPVNDIIVLIADAEEVGLLGAKAFVNKYPWANNVGAVLNFEARGTAGSSYMLMETNGGNHNLLESFKSANVDYPSSNSLGYSIYKMLPNDTDLSVFRKDKDIIGFNFAFIGDHFNYHTKLDNSKNLSLDSLAHQASYLLPMLKTLSTVDLTKLHSERDDVYFQIPFGKTISYSFDSALMLSLINLLLFIGVIILGVKNNSLTTKEIFLSSLPLFKSMILVLLSCFVILKFLYWLHPHYSEILQGFTYNGYLYIAFFSLLSIAIVLSLYQNTSKKFNVNNAMVIPVFLWIIIGFLMALFLTGAHFIIIIGFTGTLALLLNTLKPESNTTFNLFLFSPVILIFTPFFMQLPEALGLAIIPFSSLLLVLLLATFSSTFVNFRSRPILKLIFIIPIIGLYVFAETKSSYNAQRPLPDSLYYFQDKESNLAYMFTRDYKVDNWNKVYFEEGKLNDDELIEFRNQHWSRAKIVAKTENKQLAIAKVEIISDNVLSDKHAYQIKITPQRDTHLFNLYSNNNINLLKLSINQENITTKPKKEIAIGSRILNVFATNEKHFIVDIEIEKNQLLDLTLIEMSPDLLKSKYFDISERPKEFMPKPFIYSDSIITKQHIKP